MAITPSASISPSTSISPSSSISPSASESKSRSPSASRSPSSSQSKSISPSRSISKSISPSVSESPSVSPSISPSVAIEINVGTIPLTGVYTLSRYSSNYPNVLDFTYPISERSGDEFVYTNVEIGAILIMGNEIFVSWYNRDASTYGIDKMDWDMKLNGAFIETKVYQINRRDFASFVGFLVAYCSLPENTNISIYYSTDYGTNWIQVNTTIDSDRMIISGDESIESTVMMMKIVMSTFNNDAPSIESAGIFYE